MTKREGKLVSAVSAFGFGLLFMYGSKSLKLTSSNEAAVSKSSFSNREFRFVSLPQPEEKSKELKSVCH